MDFRLRLQRQSDAATRQGRGNELMHQREYPESLTHSHFADGSLVLRLRRQTIAIALFQLLSPARWQLQQAHVVGGFYFQPRDTFVAWVRLHSPDRVEQVPMQY